MKYFLFAFLLFFCINPKLCAQERKFTYIQFDVAVSITGNPERNETEDYPGQKNNAFFVPDGLGSKLGYGIHYKKWVTLGIHTGIDYKWDQKFVAVPVYLNLGLSPKVGEETRIVLQAGYGKGFALGRGNLSGEYKKIRLGIGSDDFTLFAEIAQYEIALHKEKTIGNISLGVSLISFDY
ncbi:MULTISPECIES: hypothetical protein [unclassified Flavobacterium]|uniref:hypothetical protein n=1 Tax=unclassified Flavobacterium TaxID=196869 RepID=UPI0012B8F9EF|nr:MULTISPECIES: hypothetical protein [unclassified Flavobacterium]